MLDRIATSEPFKHAVIERIVSRRLAPVEQPLLALCLLLELEVRVSASGRNEGTHV